MSFPGSWAGLATGRVSRPAAAAGSRLRSSPAGGPSRLRSAGSTASRRAPRATFVHACPSAGRATGLRVACVGGGPASLTVARDLMPLGYHVTIIEQDPAAGGFIRTQIPHFRLPEEVIDEEVGYILDMGVELRAGERVDSMKRLLDEDFDAIFVGTG